MNQSYPACLWKKLKQEVNSFLGQHIYPEPQNLTIQNVKTTRATLPQFYVPWANWISATKILQFFGHVFFIIIT